ncbi:MAG: hypothetical protein HYX39_13230 [Bacteroidetes bacterium]|nr:hypothetical protein [Bacteroidota bacterium]
MKTFISFFFITLCVTGFTQEIKRISKARENISEKNKSYANAITAALNPSNSEIAYKGQDSLIFKKEMSDFFNGLENALRSNDGSLNFISNNKRMEYVVFISNTGYIDAFYYDFEDGKLKIPFMGALNSYIANYKWPSTSHQKFTHKGIHTFKN